MIVEGESVLSRLLSPQEAARLMGLPDDYVLPSNYNEAYHLAGDMSSEATPSAIARCSASVCPLVSGM